MTTLHLTKYYSPHIGGVEKHVAELLHNLPVKNWRKIVITLQHDDKLPDYEVVDGVEIYRLADSRDTDKIKTWIAVGRLWRLFRQADVIHVHDVFWWLLPLYVFFAQKVYITFHGWEGQYPVDWKAKLQRFIYSQLSQARVHIGDYIQEFYWDRPTMVLYGGVKKSPKPVVKKINPAKLNIVFLGRLTQENDIAGYCQLLKKLRSNKIKYQMTWVGDGPWAKDCQKYGTVTGWVNNTDRYVVDSDLVLANSYLSMFEAQSAGKVVVSLFSHQLKKRYLETYPAVNSLIYGSNPDNLTDQIIDLISDKKLFTKLQLQSMKVAKSYSWSKLTNQYLKLWQVT